MILSIQAIDDPQTLAVIADQIAALSWEDGRATAGKVAGHVKVNHQAIMSDAPGQALRQTVLGPITENSVLRAAAQPRRFSHFLVSKTQDGGHYGAHIDNALMGQGDARMRSDLSFTLFLSDPSSYDGGELVIQNAGVEQRVKGEPGTLILYPSSTIHEVTPVTSGKRIVCIGWIESLIADGAKRELLFDMENLRVTLRAAMPVDAPELLMLDKTIANLMRMWAQP